MKKNKIFLELISKKSPLVTVICLCYNHSDFVIQTLNSVKRQTYTNVQLIIIDDFSTDKSRSRIQSWQEKYNLAENVIFNTKNLGMTKSFNLGLDKARGQYIIDLAADDILNDDCIEKHIENFQENNFQIGVSFGNSEDIDNKGSHLGYRYSINKLGKAITPPPHGDVYLNVVHRYFISSPTIMPHIEVYKKLNGYDPKLYFEDLDFLIRASRIYPFFYCDHLLVKKRILNNSMSSDIERRNRGSYLHRKSFFKIYLKANKLNRTKAENIALIKRVGKEFIKCFKLFYPNYFFINGTLLFYCMVKHIFLKKSSV